jgi:hypothetical protein
MIDVWHCRASLASASDGIGSYFKESWVALAWQVKVLDVLIASAETRPGAELVLASS